MKYLSSKEISEKWGISMRSVQYFCAEGKIPGAKNLGRQWIIPADAVRPSDNRIKTSDPNAGKYRFPLFIYSSAYTYGDSLSPTEYDLLSAQLKYLEGNYTESIRLSREVLSFNVPEYIFFGAYSIIALCSLSLGNHQEYKKSLSALETIISPDNLHLEDYRLIICSIKYHVGFNHRIFDSIDIARLSSDALYFYQYQCILSVVFNNENVSLGSLHTFDAVIRQISADGIAPLEANMRFALAPLHTQASGPLAREYTETACEICLSNDWMELLQKNFLFEKTLFEEYLKKNRAGQYEKILEMASKNYDNWRMLNKQEAGIYPFESFSPSDISILFMIYQGLSNSQICTVMGMSTKELNTIINNCCETAKVKNRSELKKYCVSQISTWFNS